MLSGVNVALGVTGSIAAVRTVELAHELRRQGAAVRAVTTSAAESIIHPWALQFATERPPVTEITGAIEHVELCGRDGWADVLLIAPATANTIGKVAAAVDDTPVTTCATTALGADVPVVVAPAMHEPMYDHPGVLDSLDRLEDWDVGFVEPRIEEGKAKIAENDDVALEVARATVDDSLADRTVIVTSGATTESIDPIRTLSNRASGRTGRAVARACYAHGADVVLVHDGPDVPWATVESVESAAEMLAGVQDHAAEADALVSAAAISDYTVETAGEKIRSGEDDLTLELAPTPKLLDTVRDAYPALAVVGFKAETGGGEDELIDRARSLLDRVGCAFVVGNYADVMGEAEASAVFVRPDEAGSPDDTDRPVETDRFEGSKTALGDRVATELATALS